MVREISSKTVTARTEHLCATCETIAVKIGEQYRRVVLLNEDANELFNWIQCDECIAANSYVRDHNYGDLVSFNHFSEWANESLEVAGHEGQAARAWIERTESR